MFFLLWFFMMSNLVFSQAPCEGEKHANITTDYIQDLPDVKIDRLGI